MLRVKNDKGDGYCPGIIILSTQIATYNCSFQADKPLSISAMRNKIKVKRPKWYHTDYFDVLNLEKAIKFSKKHASICISSAMQIEDIPANRVYFNLIEKHLHDPDGSIWATFHEHNISKKRK